jgi:hypothetical protein
VERLANVETYNGGKECIHAIKKIRALLRSKAIALLNTETEKTSIDFLLELLLVLTTEKDVKVSTKSQSKGVNNIIIIIIIIIILILTFHFSNDLNH